MTESKATPRPWHRSEKRGPHGWVILDADGYTFAETNTKGQADQAITFANAHDRLARMAAAGTDLLAASKSQHEAIDILFAMLIERDPDFRPSKCAVPWGALLTGNVARAAYKEASQCDS